MSRNYVPLHIVRILHSVLGNLEPPVYKRSRVTGLVWCSNLPPPHHY